MAIEDTGTQGQEASDTALCARCGMEQSQWSVSQGVQNDRELYCCNGCAEGAECVCAEVEQPAEQIGTMESEGGGSRGTEQPHGRGEADRRGFGQADMPGGRSGEEGGGSGYTGESDTPPSPPSSPPSP